VIELLHVSTRYGDKRVVDDLSFTVQPGVVTGFLGPNGAGTSTTMRLILGLDAPTAGDIRLDGRAYGELAGPLHEVGALLEARRAWRPLRLLWAKLMVFCTVTFALMLWCALVAFFGVQAIVARQGTDQALSDPDALRVVIGTGLYLTVIGARGVGLGALLRNRSRNLGVRRRATRPARHHRSAARRPPCDDQPMSAAERGLRSRDNNVRRRRPLIGVDGHRRVCAYTTIVVGLAAWRVARDDA
jgi:energy-coupling factor transporter ATP-binding protein EcfA2